MNTSKNNSFIMKMTLPIVIFMAASSITSILNSSVYKRETADWICQCLGQDYANLFCVIPLLLITSIFSLKGSKGAKIIWFGTMLTNIYSYVIYSFSVHFNFLFHFYCIILGLSLFGVIGFTLKYYTSEFKSWFSENMKRTPFSVFLLIVGILFSLLWLKDTIPASIENSLPSSISKRWTSNKSCICAGLLILYSTNYFKRNFIFKK